MSVLVLSACSAAKDKTESSTNKQVSSSKVSVEKKEAEKISHLAKIQGVNRMVRSLRRSRNRT